MVGQRQFTTSSKPSMRRFTRLTNGFSKKVENHYHMVCLYAVFHNFVRIHKTLRCAPAIPALYTPL